MYMKNFRQKMKSKLTPFLIAGVFCFFLPGSNVLCAAQFNPQNFNSAYSDDSAYAAYDAQGLVSSHWQHAFGFLLSEIYKDENLLTNSNSSKKIFSLLTFVTIPSRNSHFYPRDFILGKSLHNFIPLYLSLKNFRI